MLYGFSGKNNALIGQSPGAEDLSGVYFHIVTNVRVPQI